MSLRIIVTGGTFDKHYDELRGELTFKRSHLPKILRHIRMTLPTEVEVTQLVDSLEMTDANRADILAACIASSQDQIVVIHGTDTMTTTAAVLGKAALAKTIVLTGAMVPFSVQGTDSLFNLGFAVACAQTLPHGVWVAMNGRYFAWQNVRKNQEMGVFELIVADGE